MAFVQPVPLVSSNNACLPHHPLAQPRTVACASRPTSSSVPRRTLLRNLAGLVLATAATAGTAEPASAQVATGRKIVNSILSGYGLPILKEQEGFTPLVQQYGRLVVEFQFPSAWIVSRSVAPTADASGLIRAGASVGNAEAPLEGRASGLTAGDYRKAEGLSFFVSPARAKDIKTVEREFIAELVTPGDATGVMPEVRVVNDFMDDEGYRIIETKYESTTVSGYTVERRGRTRATMLSDGKIYALTGSCSQNRWKKIGSSLLTALDSFHVFRL